MSKSSVSGFSQESAKLSGDEEKLLDLVLEPDNSDLIDLDDENDVEKNESTYNDNEPVNNGVNSGVKDVDKLIYNGDENESKHESKHESKNESTYNDIKSKEDSIYNDIKLKTKEESTYADVISSNKSKDNLASPNKSKDNLIKSEQYEELSNKGTDCDDKDDCWSGFIRILILAIFVTILFLIFCYPSFDMWLTLYVPNSTYRWLCRGLLFFILLIVVLLVAAQFF